VNILPTNLIPSAYLLPTIAVLIFLTIYLLVSAAFRALSAGRLQVLVRLDGVRRLRRSTGADDQPLEAPFSERVVKPFFNKLSTTIGNMAPQRLLASVDRKLLLAGRPWGMRAGQFITFQGAMVLGLGGLTLLLLLTLGSDIGRTVLTTGLVALVGLIVPQFMVSSRISARQHEVERTLPDALDLLVVSVEAGLALDMAMAKVTEKMHGVLAREFARTLHEIKLGKVRREALRDMADRLGVQSLSSFVGAIIQADRLGVSMGNVLRIQAENMRRIRRQRAEEQAMKAPVKMLIPMILFIFPALFVVILGPAIIQLAEIFGDTF